MMTLNIKKVIRNMNLELVYRILSLSIQTDYRQIKN
jgi:hypothetical protein